MQTKPGLTASGFVNFVALTMQVVIFIFIFLLFLIPLFFFWGKFVTNVWGLNFVGFLLPLLFVLIFTK